MWVGNLFLVILNLPLIGLWIKLLTVKYRLLYPAILIVSTIGVYSVSNSAFLVYLMAGFAVLGYLFTKLQVEPAPLLLGFVLGPMMEENLRRAMTLSGGDPTVFFTRPLSLTLLLIAVVLLMLMSAPALAKRREQAFEEPHEV
jgi:putative tricarboxylic transport membrane protein